MIVPFASTLAIELAAPVVTQMLLSGPRTEPNGVAPAAKANEVSSPVAAKLGMATPASETASAAAKTTGRKGILKDMPSQ